MKPAEKKTRMVSIARRKCEERKKKKETEPRRTPCCVLPPKGPTENVIAGKEKKEKEGATVLEIAQRNKRKSSPPCRGRGKKQKKKNSRRSAALEKKAIGFRGLLGVGEGGINIFFTGGKKEKGEQERPSPRRFPKKPQDRISPLHCILEESDSSFQSGKGEKKKGARLASHFDRKKSPNANSIAHWSHVLRRGGKGKLQGQFSAEKKIRL